MSCLNMWNKAKRRVQSWHKTEFYPSKVRDPIFGNIITISIAEASAYKIIMQDVRVGALPWYMPYLLLSVVAMFEVILAPLVAWLGYKKRKRMMLGWSLGFMLASFGWFIIPSPDKLEETEFCGSSTPNTNKIFVSLSTRTTVRMSVTIFVVICFCLARVATWSHYIAYTDDQDPSRTSIHFGILLIARVFALIFGYKMLADAVEKSVLFQILIIILLTLYNSSKIYFFVPSTDRQSEAEKAASMKERGFFKSLFRVLCNVLAMCQMMAMGLLAAALWGFGYNEEDIIKTNFNMLGSSNASVLGHYTEFLSYIVAIVSVGYVGVKQSFPIRSEYEIPRALKQISKMTIVAMLMYVLIVVAPPCKKGNVAGLEKSNIYTHPSCSLMCACIGKWNEYSPVCVVDTMTTYLSPCEAGCTRSQMTNNLKVYSNCTCAGPSGQVAPGACSNINCQIGYNFHKVAYGIIITVSVLAFQSQGMVIVKSVDPRDKSIAMGVMWSIIATFAYLCGNNVFLSIAWKTCSWYTGDRCQLYQQRFTYSIGFTCAALACISLIINLVARGYLRIRNKLRTAENDRDGVSE